MKLIEIFRISLTNLRSNRMRSMLTIIGISIGIASIVFLVSLGYGLQALSIKKIASIEAISTLDISPGKSSTHAINEKFLAEIAGMEQVDKVSPLLSLGTKIEHEGNQTDAVGNFINDDYRSLEGLNPTMGAFFSNSAEEAVVSTALLKALSLDAKDAISKKINVQVILINPETKERSSIEKSYKIIGIVQDESTSYAYYPLLSIKDNISWPVIYSSTKAKINDSSVIQQIKEEIISMGYTVTSIADTISQVDRIFRIIQIVLAFFGLVALMVASIGMFNTMTIALLERTRDIGIMKAIGVRNRDVSKIFLIESALLASAGGVMGVLGGWILSKLINFVINLLANSVGGEPQLLFDMPAVFAAAIIIFSLLVGLATGFYPSKRASKLNPLDALRYE